MANRKPKNLEEFFEEVRIEELLEWAKNHMGYSARKIKTLEKFLRGKNGQS